MKFVNITNTTKGQKIVKIISGTSSDKNINIYTHNDTLIIFSQNGNTKHTSLSNENRKINENEITYAIKTLLKTRTDNVKALMSSNGVLHIFYEMDKINNFYH